LQNLRFYRIGKANLQLTTHAPLPHSKNSKITQWWSHKKTSTRVLVFFIAFSQKSTAYTVSENKFTSWMLRGVKPSTGSGLERPNTTHIAIGGVLFVGLMAANAEPQSPRKVVTALRRTPKPVSTKTANSNSVYIQLV